MPGQTGFLILLLLLLGFGLLRQRLLHRINSLVQRGEFSERSLAHLLGISQSQVHKLLKGDRGLSVHTADLILTKLGLSLLDLMTPEE
jgi:predicted XRE-type DNA-binding protein